MGTYYLRNIAITSTILNEMVDGTYGTEEYAGQGWVCDKKASPNFSVFKPDIVRASTTFVQTEPTAFSQWGYRSVDALSGSFANVNWVLNGKVRSNTYYAQKGRVKFRLWRSVNADGASATQVTPGWQQSAQIGFTTANQDQTFSITWTPGATVSLSNEYLFLEAEWSAEISGGNKNAAVNWHEDGAAEYLTTPTWTPGETAATGFAKSGVSIQFGESGFGKVGVNLETQAGEFGRSGVSIELQPAELAKAGINIELPLAAFGLAGLVIEDFAESFGQAGVHIQNSADGYGLMGMFVESHESDLAGAGMMVEGYNSPYERFGVNLQNGGEAAALCGSSIEGWMAPLARCGVNIEEVSEEEDLSVLGGIMAGLPIASYGRIYPRDG